MRKASLGVVSLISILFSALIFSSSAYAEVTTLTVSNSGETISFDKIKPSGSGTVTKATDSLSINTNCTEGIDLYMSAQNGSSHGTSLINNTANSNNEITTLSGTTIGDSSTAKALSNNTWGFNTVDDNTYYGLPTYANAMSHAVYSGTDSSIPIYYGAKVTSSMATGKYNGSVLYTVLVNMNCNNYTVEYDINTPEGAEGSIVSSTPPDDTILTYAKKSKLAENTFEITGYNFLGWSLDPTATTPEYDANTTEYYGSDIALAASADPGGTITMYAIWEEQIIYMQDWAMEPNFGCGKLQPNEIVTLTDSRDNHKYKVKKLPDGNCWMIQNLTISATGMVADVLDNTNTNIPASDSNSYYLPPQNTRYSSPRVLNDPDIKSASDPVDFSSSYPTYLQVGYRAKNTTDNNTGNPVPEDTAYYNFYTTTLGYYYYQDYKNSGSSPRDICPKGWRLPKVTDNGTSITATSSEFANLARSYNSNASWAGSATDGSNNYYTSDSSIRTGMIEGDASNTNNGYAGFTYAGFYSTATLNHVGAHGHYWSSSIYDSYSGYKLNVQTSFVYPQDNNNKANGLAIRCIAQGNASGYMQDFDSSTLAEGESTTLIDKRDGSAYTVKKFGTGSKAEVWMTSNLILGHDKAYSLTNELTNIPDNDSTTYYLPQAGKRAFIWATSPAGDATFYTDYANQSHVQYASASTLLSQNSSLQNAQDTGYYNFYGATLGCAYHGYNGIGCVDVSYIVKDICPKGWQLPRGSDASSKSWFYLDQTLNGSSAGTNRNDSTARNRFIDEASFLYSGYYSSSQLTNVGSLGFWMTPNTSGKSYAYYLEITSSGMIAPQAANSTAMGVPIRCVAKTFGGYMQDADISALNEDDITILVDKRDNQKYPVYRFPSNSPYHMEGYAIMAKDLSLGYVSGGPDNNEVIRGSNLTISTETSAGSGTILSRSGSDDWSSSNDDSNLQYANHGVHSYYSWPAAQIACPKGWRLPTSTEDDYIFQAVGNTYDEATIAKLTNTPLNFTASGRFTSSGFSNSNTAYYWSSSQYNSNTGYLMFFGKDSISLNGNGDKSQGMSVRCIAAP